MILIVVILLTLAPIPLAANKEPYPVGTIIPWGENRFLVKEIRYNRLRNRKEYRLGDTDITNRWPGWWYSARDVKTVATLSPTNWDDPRIKYQDRVYGWFEEEIK